jgi:hypothetical protein
MPVPAELPPPIHFLAMRMAHRRPRYLTPHQLRPNQPPTAGRSQGFATF